MAGVMTVQHYLGRIMQDTKSGIKPSTILVIFGAVRFVVGTLTYSVYLYLYNMRLLSTTISKGYSLFFNLLCFSAAQRPPRFSFTRLCWKYNLASPEDGAGSAANFRTVQSDGAMISLHLDRPFGI